VANQAELGVAKPPDANLTGSPGPIEVRDSGELRAALHHGLKREDRVVFIIAAGAWLLDLAIHFGRRCFEARTGRRGDGTGSSAG
jgi:hypothetical protein